MKLAAAALVILAPAWSFRAPQAAPVTFTPFHDTWVRYSPSDPTQADLSFGNSPYLSAENNSSTMERCYMEFNTSSLAGQTIASATLRVWVIRDNAGGGVADILELYPIYSTWDDGLTYTTSAVLTKGAMVDSVATTDYPGPTNDTAPPQALDFNVTSLVQSWASGGTNEGLVIQFPTTANADYRFASIDNPDPALKPVLTVTASGTTPPPGPPPPGPGPTPPTAPTGSGSEGDEGLCGALGIEAVLLFGLLGFTRRRMTK